jgi:ribonucleoside-triphosphate reductase (thioredoxin)
MLIANKEGISARDFLSEAKFYESYSRYDENKNRYETWDESVDRVMDMHKKKYAHLVGDKEFDAIISKVQRFYKNRKILGAQRALQFGGDQLLKHEMKLYNCVSGYADRAEFFNEYFYILLCGCGAGYSVQKHHINKLPNIKTRSRRVVTHVIEDSIEGWADALGALMSSFFEGGGAYPHYENKCIYFDSSKIRQKGAKISGGFLAPGPEPLISALFKIEAILNERAAKSNRLRPIDVYDIACHVADAVLSGGVRRAATICLFSADDEEMMAAKTGNWFVENPQRARSNNSMMMLRQSMNEETIQEMMNYIKEYGEPGFILTDDLEITYNPCVEIGMFPQFDGVSGWQGCNLVEGNGASVTSKEEFLELCEVLSMLGTLQAGYTNFKYVSDITKKIFEREALLGVSITGWMNSPHILLDEELLRKGAEKVKATNKKVAKLIGINPAARTTCVKPSGNASVLLGTAPATQGEHSKRYLRITQMNKISPIAKAMVEKNPYMVEESVWSKDGADYVIMWPMIAPKQSYFKEELHGVEFLKTVKMIQENWVNAGTDLDLCVNKNVRHNVSNTTLVMPDDWEKVGKFIFRNKEFFAGISFIAATGDKDYPQAPFTAVLTSSEIVKKYGDASMFASGLIVDSTKGFRNLWEACNVAIYNGVPAGEIKDNQSEWVRRFKKFADSYFEGDMKTAEYCLKDVALLHKWNKIQQTIQYVDFNEQFETQLEIDIDTTSGLSCYGGACEI